MKIKPYKYNILVKVLVEENEKKTDSGIVLINNDSQPYIRAEILEVGDDINQMEGVTFDLQKGDIVYVQKMTGVDLSAIESNTLIITPDKIICKEINDG